MMYLRHMRRELLGRDPGDGLPAAAPVENPGKSIKNGRQGWVFDDFGMLNDFQTQSRQSPNF
jgi:hypothetical protein